MTAMMTCLGFLPFSMSLSANVLSSGLKVRAVMTGMKRLRLSLTDAILVIGVRVRPEVPLW